MNVIAVIPARGGSKGVPRKSIRPVNGVPLIVHPIRAALAASRVDAVVVTTDDDEIAEIASKAGAEVVRRPAELAVDSIMPEPAIIHVLDSRRATGHTDPDITVLVQTTAPLVEAADIDGTIALLAGADSAFAAAPFPYFLWREGDDGTAVAVNHDQTVRLPRQDLPPQYLEAGSVYAMKTPGLRAHRHRFFGRVAVYGVPRWRVVEIDDKDDIAAAEALLERRSG